MYPDTSCEILVTGGASTSPVSNSSAADIVKSVKSTAGGGEGILGARKLPSGAIALTFESIKVKGQWTWLGKVTEVFGEGASIHETTYDVIVFGVPLGSISGIQPKARLEAVISQNPSMATSLRRVGVMKPRGNRRHETAILGFASPQDANAAIDSGVLWESSVLNVEPFAREVRLGRCYRCQTYGKHTAQFCHSTAVCGWCATTGHTLELCPDRQNMEKKACFPCGGVRGHCVLDRLCPSRIKEESRAKAAYDFRPARFEARENNESSPPPAKAIRLPHTPRRSTKRASLE